MTEINEAFFRTNIERIKTQLEGYKADQRNLFATHQCGWEGINPETWCGDRNSYKRGVFLHRQINFLMGKLEQFRSMLERFLKRQDSGQCGGTPPAQDATMADDTDGLPLDTNGTSDSSGNNSVGSEPPAIPLTPTTSTATGTSVSQADLSWLDKAECRKFIMDLLGKQKGDTVSEERLQHGLLAFLIKNQHGEQALDAYLSARKEVAISGKQDRVEQRTRGALTELVSSGVLTQDEAEKLHGLTFKAAQIDSRAKKLGGAKGSDAAVGKVIKAIHKAFDHLFTALHNATPINPQSF
ncbi:MAG: hypothetical protein ACO3XO_01535 [Bdellovibrionota bacterium]